MAFNPALHPHAPAGTPAGGQFTVAKGGSPAPSKKPAKNGSRYSKQQFTQLQSLQKQAASGKKLTAKQAHALHVAHELHLQHEAAVTARPKAAKRTVKTVRKTATVAKAAPKRQSAPMVTRTTKGPRAV